MSCRPKIGGKLREETSGVDKSQAGYCWWGLDPEKEEVRHCVMFAASRAFRDGSKSSGWRSPLL
jgi:hypothetical protein